jgi:hypothetical protein
MQAVATLRDYTRNQTDRTGALVHWISEIFGCAHKEMSRPFSRHGETYRVCIACGARRRFDQKAWKSRGPFYYRNARTSELLEIDKSSLRVA